MGPGTCSIGSENVIINGLLAFRVGDKDTPHGVPVSTPGGIVCIPRYPTSWVHQRNR